MHEGRQRAKRARLASGISDTCATVKTARALPAAMRRRNAREMLFPPTRTSEGQPEITRRCQPFPSGIHKEAVRRRPLFLLGLRQRKHGRSRPPTNEACGVGIVRVGLRRAQRVACRTATFSVEQFMVVTASAKVKSKTVFSQKRRQTRIYEGALLWASRVVVS